MRDHLPQVPGSAWPKHEIRGIFWWSISVANRHQPDARARMTSPSNLPSQDSASTCGPTRPPWPRCRVRSALRLRPSAEAPHGRPTTTLRRDFVPVGAIAVRGCRSRAEPSCRPPDRRRIRRLATFSTRALDLARALEANYPSAQHRWDGMERWLWAERTTSNRRMPNDSDRDVPSCVVTYPYPAKNVTDLVP